MTHGEQWQVIGTRAMGMGGAFVGMAKGPIAQYWNPAGLYQESNISGLDVPVGANIEFTGNIMENASAIGELADKYSAIQSAQTSGGAIDADKMAAFVKTLALLEDMNEPGKGALAEFAAGANLKLSKIAVSINNFTSAGANPFVDTTNIGLGEAGASLIGIKFDGAGTTGANSTVIDNNAYDTAQSTLKIALDSLSTSVDGIITIVCGTDNSCASQDGTITTNSDLANALVNYANANGISPDTVINAANTITQYSNETKGIIDTIIAKGGGDYTNNTSNLTIEGASFTEIAFGMAKPFLVDGLTVGGNVKLVNGRIAYTSFTFLSEQSGTTDAFDDFFDDTKGSWKPAIDLGFMWDINKKWKLPMNPRAGLVIRNLNAPKFDKPDAVGGQYQLDRQIRFGFAISPANFWHVALDMDITKNDTPVDGFKSRQMALGTEINIFNRPSINIPLRAGLMKNLAESDSKVSYTLGFGINLIHLHIDVAGVVSSDKTEIEGEDIPRKFGGSASIGLLF